MDLCTFSVGDTRYGIPVWSVEEIFRPVPITMVPGSDPRIAGIINLRGSSAVCIDLRRCLLMNETACQSASIKQRMILLEAQGDLTEEALEAKVEAFEEPVVLLADCVHHIDRANPAHRHPRPAHMMNGFVDGVFEREYGYLAQLNVAAIAQEILSQGVC